MINFALLLNWLEISQSVEVFREVNNKKKIKDKKGASPHHIFMIFQNLIYTCFGTIVYMPPTLSLHLPILNHHRI